MNKTTKIITINAIGVALYCVMGMSIRIPLISHIAVDLGYIVLAVYAYMYGPISGAIVGGAGAGIVSVLTGWFAPGWVLGNILIGALTGLLYKKEKNIWNILITIVSVCLGILVVKTVVECNLYNIPYLVKIPKNLVAFVTDSIVMCIGLIVAKKLANKNF